LTRRKKTHFLEVEVCGLELLEMYEKFCELTDGGGKEERKRVMNGKSLRGAAQERYAKLFKTQLQRLNVPYE
jgi:hypothetical protein